MVQQIPVKLAMFHTPPRLSRAGRTTSSCCSSPCPSRVEAAVTVLDGAAQLAAARGGRQHWRRVRHGHLAADVSLVAAASRRHDFSKCLSEKYVCCCSSSSCCCCLRSLFAPSVCLWVKFSRALETKTLPYNIKKRSAVDVARQRGAR